MILGIKEGFKFTVKIHYVDPVLVIDLDVTDREEFEKVVETAALKDLWKDISQYV